MKKNVILRAPLLTQSGYGVHARQIFKWLYTRKDLNLTCQILNWGNTGWLINPDLEDGIVGKIMSCSSPIENKKFDISFQLQLPDEWDSNLAKFNVGMSAVVETDRCNTAWINNFNSMDMVIVPSNHVKNTIKNTGQVKTKIIVIPEWFNQKILLENDSFLNLNLETNFNFLCVSQLTGGDPSSDRKNILNTVKWFCEVFKDDKDVGLILKANQGKGTKIDRDLTTGVIKNAISYIRKGDYPKIHILHGNLTKDEMSSLYKDKSIKALISLTRGEGFGLPIIDAAASGMPVIATNWSAHLDYMSLGRFISIDYNMVNIPNSRVDGRIFLEGFRWADPIEEDFKMKIRRYRNKYSLPKVWARDLAKVITKKYSESSIMNLYDKAYDSIIGKSTT